MKNLFQQSIVLDTSFNELNLVLSSHGFKSGEIILKLSQYGDKYLNYQDLIKKFLPFHKIKIIESVHQKNIEDIGKYIKEIDREELDSILRQSFSIKLNYTIIDKPFSQEDIKEVKTKFLSFFPNKPVFYTFKDCDIFLKNLSFAYPWISSGVLVIDENNIGLLWVNDLYD
jgi:hypothetical protein